MVLFRDVLLFIEHWVKRVCPLLVLAQAALPVYIISVQIFSLLISPAAVELDMWSDKPVEASRPLAYSLSVANIVLLLLWISPLFYALWQGHWNSRRRRRPTSAPWRHINQGSTLDPLSRRFSRRRRCSVCQIDMEDRMQHSTPLNRCLPLYDHSCYWWGGPVYMDNLKAYWNFIFWVMMHQVFCFAVGIWALKTERIRGALPWVWIFVTSGMFVAVSLTNLHGIWDLFATNVLMAEAKNHDLDIHVKIRVCVPGVYDGGFVWDGVDPSSNPWNMGAEENRRLLMGPAWSWFFFWTSTPLMKLGVHPNRVVVTESGAHLSPLPAPRPRLWFLLPLLGRENPTPPDTATEPVPVPVPVPAPAPETRRQTAVSTGTEEIELESIEPPRRRQISSQ